MSYDTQAAALAAAPGLRRGSLPDSRRALAIAGVSGVALVLTWIVAELVPAARLKDAALLYHFTALDTPHVERVADTLLMLVEPVLLVIWTLALVLFAVARGRARLAAVIAVVMMAAPLSANVLKPLVAHRHDHIGAAHVGAASWPSGHSTAALALVLCALLVAPSACRRVVAAVGGLFALAIGCALLVRSWHMPSDVLGGYLLATSWVALAVAALHATERRWPALRVRPGAS